MKYLINPWSIKKIYSDSTGNNKKTSEFWTAISMINWYQVEFLKTIFTKNYKTNNFLYLKSKYLYNKCILICKYKDSLNSKSYINLI